MIIDFHVHVLPPEEMSSFTGTGASIATSARRKGTPPTTIENALEAAKIGGVDITVISNPLHNLRDMDRKQQLERCQRQNRFHAACQAKYHSIVGMASTVPVRRRRVPARVRARHQAGRAQGRLDHVEPARAAIRTTTMRCRSSSWRASSTCRW